MKPRPFPDTFKHFSKLVIDLHVQWQMLRDLHEDVENYEVFNATAPNFFIHLREYLYDVVFLSISRFFDAPKMRRDENLTLFHLHLYKEVRAIHSELNADYCSLTKLWESGIKTWRNKRVSHNDLPTIFDPSKLPEVPNKDIETLVNGICEFTNKIEHHVAQRDMSYEVGISGWVPELVRYLKWGVEARKKQLEKE